MSKPIKLTVFAHSRAEEPAEQITVEELVERIKSGHWKVPVLKLRSITDPGQYKKVKERLPGITVSGEYKSRNKYLSIAQRLKQHSGLICLDIDAKDNPKMRTQDLIDNEALCQYISCSGKGVKIIYCCEPTKDPAVHRRIYDAAVQRLEKKGIKLKIDPIVKSIISLQFVSHDPAIFYRPKTKLIIKALPPIKRAKYKPSEDQQKDIAQLEEYIEALEDRDPSKSYEEWLNIAFGLSYSLGEAGRPLFHKLSKNYPEYSESECDEKYDGCLEKSVDQIERPVTLATVYQIINSHLPKIAARQLAKKYNNSHTTGVGEDEGEQQGDLVGMVRYKLFLFKKIIDKETSNIIDLQLHRMNLNAFETLLRSKGFFRYEDMYVHIVDNIVEKVDKFDILRIITEHIEQDGNYSFSYKGMEYTFSWEEVVHLWREVRAYPTTFNQISAGLSHWQPNLIDDTIDLAFIPYKNGVLRVSKKDYKLLPYSSINKQIWKEQILPREFTYTQEIGMFEEFFGNTCGRGKDRREQLASDSYKRAAWAFGYALHTFRKESVARAWILYDTKPGNNGRTGKTINARAVGKIRPMSIIDGKQVDFRNNRFALQKVNAWTKVVLIDDLHKGSSLVPFFNMITGETDTEKKGQDQLSVKLKFIMTSNWIMEAKGTSELGRQFITQVDDYYIRYAKEHKNTIQPIVHKHGKEFFTEWDTKDWNKFDSFAVRCIQYHLGKDAPENIITGNILRVRFIQTYDQDLFFELASAFCSNVKRGKEGSLLIGQKLLINVIKDSADFNGKIKSGRTVREFLDCIGCGDTRMTSVVTGSMTQAAYAIDKQWEDLDFGEVAKQLSKPRL